MKDQTQLQRRCHELLKGAVKLYKLYGVQKAMLSYATHTSRWLPQRTSIQHVTLA